MSTVPVGTVTMYAGDTSGSAIIDLAGAGWLVCDGSLYRRTSASYSPLFTVIGTAFGADEDEFAVPSFKGVFLRGVSGAAATDPDRNGRTSPRPDLLEQGNSGNAVGSVQRDSLRTHNHGYKQFGERRNNDHVQPRETINEGVSDASMHDSGGAEARPVNLYVNFIIKYKAGDAQIPVGAVVPYAGALPDDGTLAANGWRACDGSGLSQTQFPALFDVIESSYGGDGGTFYLPDYRGRFLRGVQGTALPSLPVYDPDADRRGPPTRRPVPGNSGNRVGSLQGDELRSHSHGYGFNNSYQYTAATAVGFRGVAFNLGTETLASDNAGGPETRPANIYVNYLIKAQAAS